MIQVLGFATLLGYLQTAIANIALPRRASPNTQYSVKDTVVSANVIFFMQCESFLEYQRQLQSRKGRDNAQTLFEVDKIPTDNQIRNILDKINASVLELGRLSIGNNGSVTDVIGTFIPIDGSMQFPYVTPNLPYR